MMKANNISKYAGDKQILKNVTTELHEGTVTALIGPSGAGKSSFIKNFAMLENPDSGSIFIGDTHFHFPPNKYSNYSLVYPKVSVVFQQFHLWPHLKVRDNLLLPQQNTGGVDQALLEEMIALFELGPLMERYPFQLSVGQKQRVAFVRAVLLKPTYLLLDEITSALDIRFVGILQSIIRKLASRGVAVMVATHLIGFAAKVADNVIFLNDGCIIEEGSIEILKNPVSMQLGNFLKFLEYER